MAKTDPNAPREYFIMDKELRAVGRTRIARGDKTVLATPLEAEFFLAAGGLSETDPHAEPKPAGKPRSA